MSSKTIRDPKKDHLLTPKNAALLILDYQQMQVNSVNSMPRKQLKEHIVALASLARSFEMPIILSTVNVKVGINKDTIPSLLEALDGFPSIDRTAINAWEDEYFRSAVEQTGRKKLIIAGLWTEACVTFPTLDALAEGYEVYPVADAVGGISLKAHETALRRMEQAGAQLTSVSQIACELQRDWSRQDSLKYMVKALTDVGALLKI